MTSDLRDVFKNHISVADDHYILNAKDLERLMKVAESQSSGEEVALKVRPETNRMALKKKQRNFCPYRQPHCDSLVAIAAKEQTKD